MVRRTVTIVFTDLVRSTETHARLAPTEAHTVSARHLDEIGELVAGQRGDVVKTMGDGLMAVFEAASDAVTFAVAAQRHALQTSKGRGAFPGLRIGIAVGEVSEDAGDYHGHAVVAAARLCATGKSGQILATSTVRLVGGRADGAELASIGALELRGLPEPVDVDEITYPLTDRPLRVLLADDAVLIRQGIARLLEDEGFLVVGQADDSSTLGALVAELVPDVVVTDVRMPPTFTTEGLEAAVELRNQFPALGVLVLSQHLESRYAEDLLGEGAHGVGYLLKDRVRAIDEFVSAIRRIAAGGVAVDPDMVALLMDRSRRDGGLDRLSARETETLALIAEGLSNSGIARRLTVSSRTVESHVSSIFNKLGLLPELEEERRVLAAIRYLRGTLP